MYAVKKAIGIYNEAIKEVTTIADPMPQVQGLFVFPNCTPTFAPVRSIDYPAGQPPTFPGGTEEAITTWTDKMAELMKKQKMWHNFLLKLRTFADLVYSHGPYTDWFYGESSKDESIAKKLDKCLREAMKSLHKTAVQCYQVLISLCLFPHRLQECKQAFEQSFFLEDLEPAIKRGRYGMAVVDCYNRIKKEILEDLEPEDDLDIKAVMKAFVELFTKLPKAVLLVATVAITYLVSPL